MIDCDSLDNGCGGGLMTQAFEAVENLGGLEAESDYPYEGHVDRKGCQLDKSEMKVSISKAVNVSTDEGDIAKFLLKHGPLSVGVNANAMQVCYNQTIRIFIFNYNIASEIKIYCFYTPIPKNYFRAIKMHYYFSFNLEFL